MPKKCECCSRPVKRVRDACLLEAMLAVGVDRGELTGAEAADMTVTTDTDLLWSALGLVIDRLVGGEFEAEEEEEEEEGSDE